MMKKIRIFLIVLLVHLLLTYLVGLSSALSLGGNPLWMKVTTWIIKFPLLILFYLLFPGATIEKSDELWADPFTYVVFSNSFLWAFVISWVVNRFSKKLN